MNEKKRSAIFFFFLAPRRRTYWKSAHYSIYHSLHIQPKSSLMLGKTFIDVKYWFFFHTKGRHVWPIRFERPIVSILVFREDERTTKKNGETIEDCFSIHLSIDFQPDLDVLLWSKYRNKQIKKKNWWKFFSLSLYYGTKGKFFGVVVSCLIFALFLSSSSFLS